ncbi:hypothetical protein BJV74DRAFT_808148 [Russula compacta]|nr:hypothetical protein BJV74DRAFT_808148 [Russula compacta]
MQQTTTDASSPATTAPKDVDHDPQTADRPGNAERYALKRTYLTLLPHTQLVELCLAFEAYSPPHVKSSLWPTNLTTAVAELQSVHPSATQDTRKDITSGPAATNAPLSSTSSLLEATVQSPSPTGVLATSAATDKNLPSDSTNSHATVTSDEPLKRQPPQTSDDTSRPISQSESSKYLITPSVTAPLQGPNPLASNSHPPTQPLPAYPHTPYYPPFGYPHTFPPQSSVPYPHAAFPSSHPPFPPAQGSGTPFPAVPLARHPHSMGLPSTDHSGMPADDLPSYEDMLVEALTDLNEPDGSAPKTLFTWMASRYPLHTNFRPSASQALQKAFKRGRLEKGSNGKYRLNASWDGGSTSRRTTRRPQSFAQMALPVSHGAPTTSPFTHAPLPQPTRGNPSTPTPTSAQEKPLQYPSYPYLYSPDMVYPGYGLSAPPPVSKGECSAEQQPVAAVSDGPSQAAAGESEAINEEVGEGSDAWEAAQAILKAINFGSLLQVTANKPAVPHVCRPSTPANSLPASDPAPASDKATDSGAVQGLSDRDRASLQARLALLAAQLAEIGEDTLASDLNVPEEDAGTDEGNGTAGEEDDMGAGNRDGLGQIESLQM